MKVKLISFLGALLIPIAYFAMSQFAANSSNSQAPIPQKVLPAVEQNTYGLLEDEKNTIDIYEKNDQAVVNITTNQLAQTWDFGTVEVPRGAGSGFVWNQEGYIVTNYHVIEGGDNFIVSFHKDSGQYQAKLVGVAPAKDIAVLKLLKKPQFSPITVGSSKNLRVGQKVIAIGNPFGLDQTVTTGIVSALDRKIEGIGGIKIYGMIQTDASINPGNSGGPLLDSQGRLIGMNTMIYSKSGTSAGVGFAVPVDIISSIVPQLIKHGKIIRPGLGIGLLPQNYQDSFGIDKGVVITYVSENSAAAKAGLKGIGQDRFGRYYLGDILLAIDGQEVNSFDDLYNTLDKYKINDEVELTLLRNEKKVKTKLKLTPLDQ